MTFIFTSGNKISFYLICLPIYFHCSLNNNYYAKVIIIESQNKSFEAIIIEFITTERSEVK